jgi:predicted nuclease of predicted toxin-antitoxin system
MSLEAKFDENLGRSHVALLQRAGYEADRVHDQGLSGAEDGMVWQRVCTESRFFITLDLDFSDVRQYPPGTHPGILLIRPRNRSAAAVARVLARVLDGQPVETLRGCLSVADEVFTRVRRPSEADPFSEQGSAA